MKPSHIIGIDIGGTKISGGLLTVEGKIKDTETLPTLAEKPREATLEQISTIIQILLQRNNLIPENIKGIGICAPGPLDPRTGMIYNPPNLPSFHNFNLKDQMKSIYNLPVLVENDANAAGLAELKIGAAMGQSNIIYVTVSTGIGTGIIINKQIYHGKNGFAGEGGHLSTDYSGSVHCGCGAASCIEGVASGTAIARRARDIVKSGIATNSLLNMFADNPDSITAKIVGDLANKQDPLAFEIIEKSAFMIGAWLGGMINLLDPDMIVIGGGVSLTGEIFFKKIRSTALKFTYNIFADQTQIIPARLLTNVGIYGAASLFI